MTDTLAATTNLACETLYRFLAAGFADPRSGLTAMLFDDNSRQLALAAADVLREQFADRQLKLGFGELPPEELDLRPALASVGRDRAAHAREYTRVFGLVTCRECPPYETEYCVQEEPFFRAQQMADIAGFYRAFGLQPTSQWRERPDHLSLELDFVATVLAHQRRAGQDARDPASDERVRACQEARLQFQRDHLCWWAPSFTLGLRNKAGDGFLAGLGRALAALLPLDRDRPGIPAPQSPRTPTLQPAADPCQGCLLTPAV